MNELIDALREIVKDAPTTDPGRIETDNYDEAFSNGGEHTHYHLAQIARKALSAALGDD